MESSSSSIRRRTTPPALPLIPCPFCRDRIITNICGPRGSQPGNRYYKCCKKDSGKCPFYEWQEGYEAYLVEQSAADGAAHNQEIFQALPRTVAQRGSFLGARQLQDLVRFNTMLGIANLLATLLLIAFAFVVFVTMYFAR
ncbi:uncharacterized protein LOC119328828 [Triticum dicoccoides]|uniref:uncharacterized protein LOC119328828 n=1 Tax=Triticum dicoccoides TaxID=85692 RepID=UPI000844293C|nr:uncharacterized protein LOC119328828 [Triticum dicoccoides]